nr:200 kDa antigen p200 [Tanacetum cinerariifolium]
MRTNADIEKQKEIPSPSKETTPKSTPTKMTKANAARGLHLQDTPPSENPSKTPQTQTTNVQNTRILSLIIQNDSTLTPAANTVEIKEKSGKNYETKVAGEKKEKKQVNKRKRDEKAKKEEVKKKMVKIKGKKKVKDDDEDLVVEEPHDEEDDNKKCESEFKSLRARTTAIPLYDATQYLSPERKTKIREMGFASMLDFLFQKIRDKLPYFVLKNLVIEKMEVSLPTGYYT